MDECDDGTQEIDDEDEHDEDIDEDDEDEDDEDDDDDDEDDIVIDDDELMQMIEAKRKERGVMSEKRAQELKENHTTAMAAEEAQLEKERDVIAREKAEERAALDAEKGKIHDEAQERLEAELEFDFKFKRNSTISPS
eukprot:m.311677 g.311677  ORF g.311677 m.311677 type:complete len:138 (-) comp27452_c3_seq13:2437-2850(-)